MARFIEVARLLVALLPLIVDAIKAAEALMPEKGQGETKLALVRAAIETAVEAVDEITEPFAELWPKIKAMVDRLVAVFNRSGTFAK